MLSKYLEIKKKAGIGPKFALPTIAFAAIVAWVNYTYFPNLVYQFHPIVQWMGVALLVVGLIVIIAANMQLHSALGSGKLITTGIFGVIRHPLYSSLIVFIYPGIFFYYGVLLFAIVPVFSFLLLMAMLPEEEKVLEQLFGKQYSAYKKKVNPVFPKLFN